MKIVFLSLLLLNLGLLAWHFWVVPPPARQPRQVTEPDIPRLRLWQAVPKPRSSSTPAPGDVGVRPAAVALRGAVAETCAEFGPFSDRRSAELAAAKLKSGGAITAIVVRPSKVIAGYWVYFPPYPSYGAAKSMAAKLRRRGVKDLFIVTGGEQRNAISVGVFAEEAGARRRRERLVRLGFKPLLGRRVHDEDRYWLQAKQPADLPVAASLAGPGRPLERHTLDCGNIAIGAANP